MPRHAWNGSPDAEETSFVVRVREGRIFGRRPGAPTTGRDLSTANFDIPTPTFFHLPLQLTLSLSFFLSLTSLCRTFAALHRSTVACVLDPEYEGDSISGITYELNIPSFPPGFFKDVEYSKTALTISKALIKTAEGGKHGGGVISMKYDATATKELRGNGNGLRGNSNAVEKGSRRLAPKGGNR